MSNPAAVVKAGPPVASARPWTRNGATHADLLVEDQGRKFADATQLAGAAGEDDATPGNRSKPLASRRERTSSKVSSSRGWIMPIKIERESGW